MLKRLLLGLTLLCVAIPAFEGEPEVSFSSPSKLGAVFLPPGLYKIRIQGAIVLLTDVSSKKSYSALVKVEKLAKRSSFTAAQGRPADGIQRVEAIVIQGEDYRLVF